MQAMLTRMKKVALMAVISAPLAGLAGCGNIEVKKHERDGHQAYEMGNFEKAVTEYNEVLKLQPDRKEMHVYIARAEQDRAMKLLGSDKQDAACDKAIKSWEHVKTIYTEKDQEWKEADSQINDILDKTGKRETGIEYYKKLAEKDPNPGNFMRIAEAQFKDLLFEDALATLDQGIEKNPEDKWLWLTKAIYLWGWGYKEKSLPIEIKKELIAKGMEAVEKCISIDPNLATPYSYRNLLYRQLAEVEPENKDKHMAQAAADVQKFKELWPAEKAWRDQQAGVTPPAAPAPGS